MAFNNLWKKPSPQLQPHEYEEFPEFSDLNVQQEMAANEARERYGRTKSISGKAIGNTMIAADIVIPSGKLLTVGGLAAKKYVDKAKLTYTDEHDMPYKIPKVQFYRRQR